MDKDRLQATLQELRTAAATTGPIDERTRELLQSVTGELQRLLEQESRWSAEDVGPVHRDLRELLLRFETQHPQFTSLLGRIADGLANLGI